MWRIWFFFGILKISFAAPVATSQEDLVHSSELAVLKCLLSSSPVTGGCDDAKRSVEKIPKRIQKLYEKLKKPLLINATGNDLDSVALDTLPASLLYLIPKVRFSSMTGFTASDIVRRFPFDDALTMKILSLFTDKINIQNFLYGLADKEETYLVTDDEAIDEESVRGIAPISPAVEKEIARALSRWFPRGSQWEYWLYKSSMITGTPVLASLPNYFLNSLSLETTEKFLFHLRNWRWDNWKIYDPSWSQHSMSVKRIWSSLVLGKAEPPHKWTPKILRQFGFILIGAEPDELSQLPADLRISEDFQLLVGLDWNSMQARAVFDVGFSSSSELTENNLNNVKHLIVNLLPRQIQQFSYTATNFGYLRLNTGISLPTGKQLFSSYSAYLISRNKTRNISSEFWKENMSSIGKFFYLMPPSFLENFQNETLDLESLSKTDSSLLSFRHARYLTNRGKVIDLSRPETVLKFKGLIKSVPSSKLVEMRSNVMSNSVKEHLLMFSSGESIVFTASVLEKVRKDLAETSYLEKMLYNKDFRQYFNLLGNRDITHKYKDIILNLIDVVNRNPVIERNIRSLPANTLSALLSVHRKEVLKSDGGWSYENLIESPVKLFISGLTCADIEILDTSDFMPVIGYYVHQRRAMNEIFPKNMQYCSQKALTRYFKLKASLRGLDNEPHGLLSLLEAHEVRAVGGYILAGLPIDVIDALPIKYHIISEIGKLTILELLTATSLENVKTFTEIYVSHFDKLNLQLMTGLGNLVWFLNEDKIQRLNPKDFKLHLESMEENAIKAFCLNEKERNDWKQLIIRTFGKPDSWSSGTLTYLGDLLFVLDSYELERINKTSRVEAADVLSKSTSFYLVLEWPGKPKPIHLYEACLEVLKISERISFRTSVKQLLRFYLESNQFLLETVSPVQSILKLNEEPNLIENAPSLSSPIISTHLTFNHFPEEDTIPVEINPAKEIEMEKEEEESSLKDYDYSSEEIEGDNQLANNNNKSSRNNEQSRANEDHLGEKIPEESIAALDGEEKLATKDFIEKESSQTDISNLKSLTSELANSTDSATRRKRFHGGKSVDDDERFSNGQKETIDFEVKTTKSYEELQKNASRALIVEVPLNRTDFSNFEIDLANHVKISCDAIKMLEKSSSLILNVKDFKNMDNEELEDCAEHLGTLNLDSGVKNHIWSRLEKWKETGNLLEVGNLVSAIGESDITKIPLRLSEPWALENLHALSTHITDPEMMLFITDQFLLKNMDHHSLRYESAVSLDRLICTMTLPHQRRYLLSHPEVFVNVAKTLGRSLDCRNLIFESCIRQMADMATSEKAFGETHKWNANDVSDLGVIVAGLKKSQWQQKDGKGLRPEAFAGLTPSAVSCIPPDVFKVLTENQLLKMPTLSAAAISSEQSSSLTPSQYEIIDRVRRQIPPVGLTASYTSGVAKPSVPVCFHGTVVAITFYTFRTFFY